MSDLTQLLADITNKSRTSKLWVDLLIKPVMIMMIYVRDERESDRPLHIAAVEQMLPHIFAPSHLDYARYGLYYLRKNRQAMPLVSGNNS